MPVKADWFYHTGPPQCLNCANLLSLYWTSSITNVVECQNEFGEIEKKEYCLLDIQWCPRWTRNMEK